MTAPDPRHDNAPQHRAEFGQRQDDVGQSSRRDQSVDQSDAKYVHAEAALGGADSIEKTSYVVGSGTEPHAQPTAAYTANTRTGSGMNVTAWVVGGITALIAAIYLLGFLG